MDTHEISWNMSSEGVLKVSESAPMYFKWQAACLADTRHVQSSSVHQTLSLQGWHLKRKHKLHKIAGSSIFQTQQTIQNTKRSKNTEKNTLI